MQARYRITLSVPACIRISDDAANVTACIRLSPNNITCKIGRSTLTVQEYLALEFTSARMGHIQQQSTFSIQILDRIGLVMNELVWKQGCQGEVAERAGCKVAWKRNATFIPFLLLCITLHCCFAHSINYTVQAFETCLLTFARIACFFTDRSKHLSCDSLATSRDEESSLNWRSRLLM